MAEGQEAWVWGCGVEGGEEFSLGGGGGKVSKGGFGVGEGIGVRTRTGGMESSEMS